MIVAAIVVPLFMIFYYRFAGLVAVAVLSLTVLLLVAIMVLVKAPSRLTALAGLALPVGMEVDNNVLIYERLREELAPRRGPADGAPQLVPSRGRGHHRRQHHARPGRRRAVLRRHRAGQRLRDHVSPGRLAEHLGDDVRGQDDLRGLRTPPLAAEDRHGALDRPHEDRLHALVPRLRDLLRVDHRAGLVVAVVRGKGLFDIDFTGGISVQTVFQAKPDIDAEKIRSFHRQVRKGTARRHGDQCL